MDYLIKPWDHQKKTIEQTIAISEYALFWEMGTGKTSTAINMLRAKFAVQGALMNTLILCPLAVVMNWKKEFKLHSRIKDWDVIPLIQSGAKRDKEFIKAVSDEHGFLNRPKIIITNYEALQRESLFQLFKEWEPEVLVCDESHRLKDSKTLRSKRTTEIADRALYRFLLTGTPILNSPMDLFSQYRILDRGETFGKNFFSFRGRYFEDANAKWAGKQNYFPKFVPRVDLFEEFSQKMYRKASRVIKSECLDLPPLVKKTYEVELSKEQSRMYNEMKKEFLTFIKDKEEAGEPKAVVAQLAITKALRLQQIVSGFVRDENGKDHELEGVPRLQMLREILEEVLPAHKVIVWAVFKENYRAIRALCEKLGVGFSELHGEVPTSQKESALERFRKDPNCRVMISNQASGGVGVNMTSASYAIYYSKNFSLEQDLQSEARNYRGGSEMHEKITRIDLVAKGTIDELVNEALSNKQNLAEKILDWKGSI